MTRVLLTFTVTYRPYFWAQWRSLLRSCSRLTFFWSRTEREASALDRVKLRLPVVGETPGSNFKSLSFAALSPRCSRAELLWSRPCQPRRKRFAAALISTAHQRRSAHSVREGQSLHAALEQHKLMPAMGLEMIEVGEASGALAAYARQRRRVLRGRNESAHRHVIAIVEPAILVFMAIVIAFILISLYLPIFSRFRSGDPKPGLERSRKGEYGNNRLQLDADSRSRGTTGKRAQPANWPSGTAARSWILNEVRIDPELFRSIPADLMFRFNFVPLEARENQLVIAVADPSQVLLSDELPLLLGKKLVLKVATPTQISDLLKRTEQSQRVLEQATEAFTLQVVAGRRGGRRIAFRRPAHARSAPSARSFGWWTRSSSRRWSAAPVTFISKRATSKWW